MHLLCLDQIGRSLIIDWMDKSMDDFEIDPSTTKNHANHVRLIKAGVVNWGPPVADVYERRLAQSGEKLVGALRRIDGGAILGVVLFCDDVGVDCMDRIDMTRKRVDAIVFAWSCVGLR